MEKIKNLLNPGHAKDDETMYAGSQSTGQDSTANDNYGAQVPAAGDSSVSDVAGSSAGYPNTTGTSSGYGQQTGTGTDPYGSSTQNSSNYPTSNTGSGLGQSTTGSSNTGNQSHLGRDAAGAGALGTGAYEAEKHHHNNNQTGGLSSTSGNNTSNFSHPTGSNTGSGLGQTTSGNQSHLGRDAAGAGALGTGAYEAEKHHHHHDNNNQTGGLSNTGSSSGLGQSTTGSSNTGNQSHLGRDAAGAGALGAGAYEAEKHHHNKDNNQGSGAAVTGPREVVDHYRHHAADGSQIPEGQLPGDLGEYDPRRGNHPSNQTAPPGTTGDKNAGKSTGHNNQSGDSSHLGRDAAEGGAAAGAAGLAAREAEKHHENRENRDTGLSGNNNRDAGLTGNNTGNQSHLGRDAALGAGGVGAAGLAGREYEQHRGNNTGNDFNNDPYHQGPLSSHQHGGRGHTYGGDPCDCGEGPHDAGFTHGPHSVDTANRLDPNISGGQGSTGGHHLGRDAAGAGALGAGAYEAEKHHHNSNNSRDPLASGGAMSGNSSTLPHRSGAPSGGLSDQRAEAPSQHHLGRDAAAVGGVGALGAGAYEADKHHNSNRDYPSGTTSGGLGGVSDNRDYPSGTTGTSGLSGSSSQQPQHHYGRDAAAVGGAGALGTGAYEAEKHHHNRDQQTGTTAGSASDPYTTSRSGQQNVDPQSQHHYGRDAALVGGGAAAAGVGEHEYSKHDQKKEMKAEEKAEKKELKQEQKAEKKELKAEEKAEKHHDKSEKKSGGLLGFLHKDKKHDDVDDNSHNKHKHEAEAAAGTGVVGAGVAEHEHNRNNQSNLGTDHGLANRDNTEGTYPGARVAPGSYGATILPEQEGQQVYGHLHHQHQDQNLAGGSSNLNNTRDPNLSEYVASHPDRYHSEGMHHHEENSGLTSGTAATSASGSHHNKLHKEPSESVRRELEQKARQEGAGSSSF